MAFTACGATGMEWNEATVAALAREDQRVAHEDKW